jgi:hypothetical protein
MLQGYDFTGVRVIDAQGSFFLYNRATNPSGLDERVLLSIDGSRVGYLLPGDRIELPPGKVARRWVLEPVSPTMPGEVMIGDARVSSLRTVGTVRVVDESAAKTLAGLQLFTGSRRGPNAVKFSMSGVQAGARPLALRAVSLTSTAAGSVLLCYGTGAPTDTPQSSALPNKLLGGAVLGALKMTGLCAAALPTAGELPGVVALQNLPVAANALTPLPLTTPIILPAGYWFGIVGPAINTEVALVCDAEEIG